MKLHRIALVTGWMVVSLIAVAGFANFTAPRDGAPAETGVFTVAPDLGSDAGAVSAMAFSYAVEGEVPIPRTSASSIADVTTTSTPTLSSGPPGTTFVRSAALSETEVRTVVSQYFQPADVGRAVRAAWCASNFNPEAVASGTGESGLFQVPAEMWTDYSTAASVEGGDILDADANAAVAAWMVDNLGWSSLTCS